jgi:hypothetical protein
MAWPQHNAKHNRQPQWGHRLQLPRHKRLHKVQASHYHDPVNSLTSMQPDAHLSQLPLELTLDLDLVPKQ